MRFQPGFHVRTALAYPQCLPLQIPYRVSADSGGNVKLLSSNAKKDFSPEEISALVLRKLVDDAANFLNDKVCCCIIG